MKLEFYFDFSCPYAYLGSTQIERVAARGQATVEWKPMLLGGVFRAVDQSDFPAGEMPSAKAHHNSLDMLRWADHFGVELVVPPTHPMRTVRALRALLSLPGDNWTPFIHEVYRAYWVRGDDIRTAETIEACLRSAHVEPARIEQALAANDDPSFKDELRARTDEAISRGIFGAPTMFVGDGDDALMFWGQDRLDMVERALNGWRPDAALQGNQ